MHRIQEEKNNIFALDYSQRGDSFAIGGDDKSLKIYDDSMKIISQKFEAGGQYKLGHESRIYSIAYNKDIDRSDLLISSGWDRNIMIYDLRESKIFFQIFIYVFNFFNENLNNFLIEKIINKITGPYVCGDSIDFKGNYILSCSNNINNQMQIFDIRNYKKICDVFWDEENDLKNFNANIFCAKFYANKANKNMFGICSSNINTIRMYDLQEIKLENSKTFKSRNIVNAGLFDRPLYSMDFSHNGRKLAFAGANNFIGILDIDEINI